MRLEKRKICERREIKVEGNKMMKERKKRKEKEKEKRKKKRKRERKRER